jgi:hypothetical protein
VRLQPRVIHIELPIYFVIPGELNCVTEAPMIYLSGSPVNREEHRGAGFLFSVLKGPRDSRSGDDSLPSAPRATPAFIVFRFHEPGDNTEEIHTYT